MRISDWSSDVCSSDLPTFVAIGADAAHDIVEVGQAAARGIGQATTGPGQQHAARMAMEQRHAQPGLEFAHVVADRAGGQAELFRRMGEVLVARSEEHTSELQSLMRISYAVFCLKKKIQNT